MAGSLSHNACRSIKQKGYRLNRSHDLGKTNTCFFFEPLDEKKITMIQIFLVMMFEVQLLSYNKGNKAF